MTPHRHYKPAASGKLGKMGGQALQPDRGEGARWVGRRGAVNLFGFAWVVLFWLGIAVGAVWWLVRVAWFELVAAPDNGRLIWFPLLTRR
jgi:hypothetical protein